MGLFGISFGSSKSKSQSNSQSSAYNAGENFSNSGSQQGSSANSFGIDRSQSQQDVYGAQAPYLQDIYANAAGLYNNYGMPDRQTADLNPMLQDAIAQRYGFGQGVGNDIFTTQLASSLDNLGGYRTAGMTADRMAGGNVYRAPVDRGIDLRTASMAAYNPFLDGQIDAASRDIVRNLGENVMTGNASMAAGTGNSGSSRRAVMDAIAQRSAGDRIADISSNLRGNAYNTGLGIAAQQGLANQQARLATNNTNAGLMQSGSDLAYRIGQAGTAGLGQAYTTGAANLDQTQAAGDYLRQYQQQVLDTVFQNRMNPYTGLQMYQSFIGAPTVLSSSNSLGLNRSNSNSFGNSFANSYGYDLGGSNSNSSATSTASSFNAGFGK